MLDHSWARDDKQENKLQNWRKDEETQDKTENLKRELDRGRKRGKKEDRDKGRETEHKEIKIYHYDGRDESQKDTEKRN